MAQAREKGGRVVFIGNIPYGVSEEQICDIFGRIGSVLNFRLVYDKETGKPKGFGFLEYPDIDQAAAAVRNLNGYEIMGRQLKVDYSNDNSGSKNVQQAGGGGEAGAGGGGSNRAPPPAHFDMNVSMGAQQQQQQQHMGMGMVNGGAAAAELIPPLPQGVDVPPGLTAPDAISKTLQAIPAPQLLDILSQMKNLVATEPQKATAILQQAPQLSYAIFQALLLLGLVDTNVLTSLIGQTAQQQQPPNPAQGQGQQQLPTGMGYQQQQQQQQPPPAYQQQQQQAPPTYQQVGPYGQPPAQPPQQNPYAQYQQQQHQHPSQPPHPGYAPTPPTQQPPYQPPQQQQAYQQPPPHQPQQQQPQATNDQLMQQVLALTREQILAMPPEARDQILGLRAQMGAPLS